MMNDYRDAITYVSHHIKENPTSSDIPMWTNALHKLKKRVEDLEECLHLGEYQEMKSLVLSRSDFDKVSNEIANPSEPSEKLVNAFRTNKSVIEDE